MQFTASALDPASVSNNHVFMTLTYSIKLSEYMIISYIPKRFSSFALVRLIHRLSVLHTKSFKNKYYTILASEQQKQSPYFEFMTSENIVLIWTTEICDFCKRLSKNFYPVASRFIDSSAITGNYRA